MLSEKFKNFSYMLFVQCGNYIFPIVTVPLIFHAYNASQIGVYSFIVAFFSYFSLLINYGFNFSGVRRAKAGKESENSIYCSIFSAKFYLFLFCTLIFLIIQFLVEDFRKNPMLTYICYIGTISIVFQQNWFFQIKSDFKVMALVSFLSKIISIIGIVILIKPGVNITYYALIVQLSILSNSLFGFFYQVKKYTIELKFSKLKEVCKLIKDDYYVFMINVLANLYTSTTIVILGIIGTSFDVGIYSSAQKIIELMRNILIVPISMIFYPIITGLFSENRNKGVDFLQKLFSIYFYFTLIIILSYFSIGRDIIKYLLGKEFLDAIPILNFMIFGFVSLFFGVIIGGQAILALKLERSLVILQSFVAAISIIINIMILPFGGFKTSALVWTLSEILMSLGLIIILKVNGVSLFNIEYFSFSSVKNTIYKSIR